MKGDQDHLKLREETAGRQSDVMARAAALLGGAALCAGSLIVVFADFDKNQGIAGATLGLLMGGAFWFGWGVGRRPATPPK